MRRLTFAFGAVLALAVAANPVQAQLQFGVEGGYVAGGFGSFSDALDDVKDRDLEGTFGLGGRIGFSGSVFGVYGSLMNFFPECDTADCSYWTGSVGAKVALPIPVLSPYIVGGWQWKAYDLSVSGFESATESNPYAGLGIQLDLGLKLFLEGTFEFEEDYIPTNGNELSVTPFVLKGGVAFGG